MFKKNHFLFKKTYLWFWLAAPAALLLFTINATTLPITPLTCDRTITLSQAETVVGVNYKLAIKADGVDPMNAGFQARKVENAKALKDATKIAMRFMESVSRPTCRVILKISEGDWYFAPEGDSSIVYRIPDMRQLLETKALVISGDGVTKTRLYFDQNVTFIRNESYLRNVTLTDFELIQYVPDVFRLRGVNYQYGLKTTQGKVLKAYPDGIDVRIDAGFPDPIVLDSEERGECIVDPNSTNSQGLCEQKYIKRFVRNSDTAKPSFPFREQKKIPVTQYPRFNHYRIEYGGVTRLVDSRGEFYHHVALNNQSADGPVFFKDDYVAFKSKHGGSLIYHFNCPDMINVDKNCRGLQFYKLKLTNEGRGVVNNIDNVSVISNQITPAAPIGGIFPVMATAAGGFQLNGGKNHVIQNNIFKGLGDDGVAFFEVKGDLDSTVISRNTIEDSWNRGVFVSSSTEACSDTIRNKNCVSPSGCAILDSQTNKKIEFKPFNFQGAGSSFSRTYISYTNEDPDCENSAP